ncbi:MAG: helix-turn-helix domain-containing protein [Rickettsiaceae bacterium]|nr:helix-turn-helix domain-containing protein [Rickettsiaceae bacterium]
MTSKLKEARQHAGYTIQDISKKLKIRKQYIIDLEEENYDAIPGKVYIEGYKKMYYEFLGIRSEKIQEKKVEMVRMLNKNNHHSKKYKDYITYFSIIMLILVILAYNFLLR